MNNFYVYMYLREDYTPYYIGKGKENRAFKKNNNEIKPPKDRSRVRFVKENISEDDAFMWEAFWISEFGRKDLGTGCLRNKTDGGEGISGRVGQVAWNKGKTGVQIAWNKGKSCNKGIPKPESMRKNLSKAREGLIVKKVVCPHCNKEGGLNAMNRYHFDLCKFKT